MLRFAEPHIYTPVDDSLVLWISGRSRGIGGKVFDLSGKGNHGTIYGARWVNTPIGHSVLSFDGVDDYVDCGNDESLNITDAITIEAWVKLGSPDVKGGLVFRQGNYGLGLSAYSGLVYYIVRLWDSSGVVVNSSVSRHIGTDFHLIGFTFDTETALIKYYLDGVCFDSDSFAGPMLTSNDILMIGKGWTGPTGFFHGLINEVRIYNRALSDEEIRERFNATKHLYGMWD